MALVENIDGFNGNKIANQFVIRLNGCIYFQSYESINAKINKDGSVSLSEHWNYSNTSRKYLYQFLRLYSRYYVTCKKDVEKLIKSGTFKVDISWRTVA